MAPKILDEHSLQAREQEIIDAALALIAREGVANVTMDKVVAKVSYSKGTVYKHFTGKEDLLLAIGNQAITIMLDLFFRASQYPGCARERMLLINFSYLFYAILHPALFMSAMCSKSPNVYEKSTIKRVQEQEHLEMKLMGIFFNLIEEAIADKSFTLPPDMDMQQICFANWSLGYGVISLLADEVESCSGRTGLVVERELFNQNNIFLDGLRWGPLSHEKDYKAGLKEALEQVFGEELARMKALGRELNF
ncbi:TetR/AcrR family transcriptional regulator [Thalassomonas viridans]|uniref:TetR/AcrR family transcriptional regulator n=1 Tax=Thalassomonas viridans TaxID=137584 RepID=A0AAF0C8L4_9GAMM|nr:TetR/AcrR family transcriptional regulator [Thalassomonas viridans]WDE04305.1 TetR/AcrR family transcriptional regulator [Thalassomonas viridans]